jgi:hypothetical protein
VIGTKKKDRDRSQSKDGGRGSSGGQPRFGERTIEPNTIKRTHEQVSTLLVAASYESRDDGVVRALVGLQREAVSEACEASGSGELTAIQLGWPSSRVKLQPRFWRVNPHPFGTA